MRVSNYGKSYRSVGRRIGLFMAFPVIISALFFGTAVAAEDEISVPFQDVLFAEPGSVTVIADIAVEARLVGEVCAVSVNADNQVSVHPGNNLVARSGTAEVIVTGIEDEANGQAIQSLDIELGDRLVVELVMGPEGVSSLGFGVSILCNEGEPDVVPVLQQSEAPTAMAATDPCSEKDANDPTVEVSSVCCTESAAPSGSASSTCCAESSSTTAANDASDESCPEPEVLGTLQEAPVAKAVTAQPTYTG